MDDFGDDRDIYSQYLTYHGCRVVTARNGKDAIDSALRVTLTSRIPVIALSCHDVDPYRRDAWTAGCAAYVTKPCLPDALLAEIRRVTKPSAAA